MKMYEISHLLPYLLVKKDSLSITLVSESFLNTYNFSVEILNKSIEKVFYYDDLKDIYSFINSELIEFTSMFKVRDCPFYSFLHIKKVSLNDQEIILFHFIPLAKDAITNILNFKYHNFGNLYNVIYFIEKIQQSLENSQENSVLIAIKIENIDILINNLGFFNFYRLIEVLQSRISKILDSNTSIAFFAEDRFFVFKSSIVSEEDVIVFIYNEIISLLEKPIYINNDKIVMSFKYGVAFNNKNNYTAEELISNASMAINSNSCKIDSVSFYNSSICKTSEKIINLKKDIIEALEKDELVLFYQPYYSLENGLVKGGEALLRWIKNDKMIPPMEFIPYLEQLGLIVDVEEWMVKKASALAKKLKDLDLNLTISLNISPDSFSLRSFLDFSIFTITKEFDVCNYIVFEVTERLIIQDIATTSFTIKKLRENGIKISIDDFGTGYSSLINLSNIDMDFLKIDMSFIKKINENIKAEKIVSNIIALGHSLDSIVVAEGIENDAIFNKLRSMGCDYGQGYFWSKPISELDFLVLAQNHYSR